MFREKVGLMQGPPPSPCYVPITSTLTNFSAFASEKPLGYYRAIIGCTILRLHLIIQYNVCTCRSVTVLGQEHMLDFQGTRSI